MNDDDFPYQAVYDHFAFPLVTNGLPPEPMECFCAAIMVNEGQVVRCETLPVPFDQHADGPQVMFAAVKEIMDEIAAMGESSPFCLVVGAEAMTLARPVPGRPAPHSVSAQQIINHPDTRRSVVLMVNRPNNMRMGMLHIDAQRQVTYGPLLPTTGHVHPMQNDIDRNLH